MVKNTFTAIVYYVLKTFSKRTFFPNNSLPSDFNGDRKLLPSFYASSDDVFPIESIESSECIYSEYNQSRRKYRRYFSQAATQNLESTPSRRLL